MGLDGKALRLHTMATQLRLPIGYDDLGAIIDNQIDVVDKSLLIKEIIDDSSQVILITRPRRFGKTLGMSWLRYFFAETVLGRKTAGLFDSFKIAKEAEYMAHQGQYPVIAITFKDIKHDRYDLAYSHFCVVFSDLFAEHAYLLFSEKLSAADKHNIDTIINRQADEITVRTALHNLTRYLYLHHDKRPIVLIDEYDAPVESAYVYDYYDDMIRLLRDFLAPALKNNLYLHKAVLTGILRIAKESMFSGLNNLKVYSLFSERYAKYFGFTEDEVDALMQRANFTEHDRADLKHWYNGYKIGNTTIYNPWSIVNAMNDQDLKPYWVNTSSNELIKVLMAKADIEFKQKLESVLRNEPVDAFINENVVFKQVDGDETSLFSLLFSAGYLKAIQAEPEDEGMNCQVLAPNYEVLLLYKSIVKHWFSMPMGETRYQQFLKNLVEGDIENFTEQLQEFLQKSISYFDVSGRHPEKFYHGFVLGLISSLEKTHMVKSNRESGRGRYDVMLIPKDLTKLGIVLEFKTAKENEDISQVAQQAIAQINSLHYAEELRQMGINHILSIGLAFKGKDVYVVYE